MFDMDKVSTKDFWKILWNQEEFDQLHLMHEFVEQGTEILEEMSGDPVSIDEVKDHLKMIIDNMG